MRCFIISLAFLSMSAAWAASAAVPADCWSLRKHGHRQEARGCFDGLTHSGDAYTRAEGFWGLEEWEQANEQFRLATQPANSKAVYKVRWGMLLHERFNNPQAAISSTKRWRRNHRTAKRILDWRLCLQMALMAKRRSMRRRPSSLIRRWWERMS